MVRNCRLFCQLLYPEKWYNRKVRRIVPTHLLFPITIEHAHLTDSVFRSSSIVIMWLYWRQGMCSFVLIVPGFFLSKITQRQGALTKRNSTKSRHSNEHIYTSSSHGTEVYYTQSMHAHKNVLNWHTCWYLYSWYISKCYPAFMTGIAMIVLIPRTCTLKVNLVCI